MHIKTELSALEERMFSKDLLNSTLTTFWQEMDKYGYEITEEEYREGTAALAAVLDERQKQVLAEMERLCGENTEYALRYGFRRGVYTGFQQAFAEKSEEKPFHRLVEDQLLDGAAMRKYLDYYTRRSQANELSEKLGEELEEAADRHLTSVDVAWEERLYGVLRHAFYLGYRYALSIVEEIWPVGSMEALVGKILLTEHELGFTNTRAEREQEQERLARQRETRRESGRE